MNAESNNVVSLYVVKTKENGFFAGFDPAQGKAVYVANPLEAKKFTNKFDIKLRPDEALVELRVVLTPENVSTSQPFRPHRRKKVQAATNQ